MQPIPSPRRPPSSRGSPSAWQTASVHTEYRSGRVRSIPQHCRRAYGAAAGGCPCLATATSALRAWPTCGRSRRIAARHAPARSSWLSAEPRHLCSRSNIHGDHSDVMGARDAGWLHVLRRRPPRRLIRQHGDRDSAPPRILDAAAARSWLRSTASSPRTPWSVPR